MKRTSILFGAAVPARRLIHRWALALLVIGASTAVHAQNAPPPVDPPTQDVVDTSDDGLWTDWGPALPNPALPPGAIPQRNAGQGNAGTFDPNPKPGKRRKVKLNVAQISAVLSGAPNEHSKRGQKGVRITLPVGETGFQRFRIYRSDMLEPGLASRFPDIQTFNGHGEDDPAAYVRLTLTERGFEALVKTAQGAWTIEPEQLGPGDDYTAYDRADLDRPPLNEDPMLMGAADPVPPAPQMVDPSGTELRQYRLAVSTSQEYYTNNGGSDAAVLAAIASRVSQLNAIYEYELAVRFVLIADNDLLLNQALDDTGTTAFNSNTATINSLLETSPGANDGGQFYDVGHVFLWQYGGGVAGLGVICSSSSKGRGQTGVNARVDVLAHEIGHMFAMYHSWNRCGGAFGSQRTSHSAYEPGSGSTLMSYAGSCGVDNLGDDLHQFHAHSFAQAQARIASTFCETDIPLGNAVPVVNVTTGSFDIPAETPFALVGSTSDADGDALLHAWTEMDLESNDPMGSPGGTSPGNDVAPYFRTWAPQASSVRYFPRMSDLLAGTTTFGEELPRSSKTLYFRLHTWDGNGGVAFQAVDTQVLVDGSAGPFRVTSPNTGAESWAPGTLETVTWDVAGTGPGTAVDCDNVAFDLSTDGGQTFNTPVVSSTPNDGSHTFTVPSVASASARLRVRCADHPDHFFFDLSDNNFAVDVAPTLAECPASGPAITVNTLTDVSAADGLCSLREALTLVDNGGTVTFDPTLVNGVIELQSQISLGSKSFTLDGGGLNLTLSGRHQNRIFCLFHAGSTPDIFISNLTLANGAANSTESCSVGSDNGGAMQLWAVRATLDQVVVRDSYADTSGGGIYWDSGGNRLLTVRDSRFFGNRTRWTGGALRVRGPFTLTGSTLADNEAYFYSNALGGGLAFHNSTTTGTRGTTLIENSTITGNSSNGHGGGIGDRYSPHAGYPAEASHTDLVIRNSTIWDNAADDLTDNLQHNGEQVDVYNSIIGGTPNPACDRPVDVNIGNAIGDNSCGVPAVSADPLLQPLGFNGGPTRTLALGPGSPALNAGSNPNCATFDQRGFARSAGGVCDIGAYEEVACDGSASYPVLDSGAADQWRLMSLPCRPNGGDTVATLLGDDLSGVYGTDWGLFRFDAAWGASGRYELLASSDPMFAGVGYWIIHRSGGGSWSMGPGHEQNPLPFEAPLEGPRGGAPRQWNLVGNPTQGILDWAQMQVVDEFGNCYGSPTVASEVGPTGDAYGLIDKAIHWYTGAGYSTCDDSPPPNPACTVGAGEAFWVEAKESGQASLGLRYGGTCASSDGTQGEPAPGMDARPEPEAPAGWAGILTVEADGLVDPVTLFGQLETAAEGHDPRDLVELSPDREPFMTAVFPHPEWGEQAGDYAYDYHPLHNGRDEWFFVVRSSESDLESLTLRWDVPQDILERSQLVDLDTGETINIVRGKKVRGAWTTEWYGLQERQFAWVLKKARHSNNR